MEGLKTTLGATRYEFRMQIRRVSVWVVLLAMSLFFLVIVSRPLSRLTDKDSIHDAVLRWTQLFQLFLPIGFGVLLADRLARDRRLNIAELFAALPAAPGGRLLGKYLGGVLATMTPLALVYFGGIGVIAARWHNVEVAPLGIAAFAAVVLPGLVFVGAFSVACPAVLKVPLYQFLFIGYWFWGNLLSPGLGVPTLSRSVLTPYGTYRTLGFFGQSPLFGPDQPQYTVGAAILSTALMLLGAAAALTAAWAYLRWQRARE